MRRWGLALLAIASVALLAWRRYREIQDQLDRLAEWHSRARW